MKNKRHFADFRRAQLMMRRHSRSAYSSIYEPPGKSGSGQVTSDETDVGDEMTGQDRGPFRALLSKRKQNRKMIHRA
jgi:hypothetical protein